MKAKRHDKILELVLTRNIYTQEDLLQELRKEGFVVTQATVSRDIKELKLVKEMNAEGNYRYVTGAKKAVEAVTGRFGAIFYESVLSIDYAKNIVAIKCRHGMANAACATLDGMDWNGVVGTLAGDDTIFVLMRNDDDAATFTKEIYKFLSNG